MSRRRRKRRAFRGGTSPRDFDPDYTYVIKDLKRIAVLAAFFITLLIVLSFLLN